MNSNIIVYGVTFERAKNKLQSILDNMRFGDIERVNKSISEFNFRTKDGDFYKAIGASENARGYKWQYAYIDKLISNELLSNVVFPKFIPKDEEGNIIYDMDIRSNFEWFE